MAAASDTIDVYLEVGKKRTIAGAIDWPGWCRAGRDEQSALQALFEAAPRYAQVVRSARLGFHTPDNPDALVVVERLKGTTTTDFGAPDQAPASDDAPIDEQELRRLQAILRASWRALDRTVERAEGKALRKGPRGGGRVLDKIVEHVRDSEASYLSALGGKAPSAEAGQPTHEDLRNVVLSTLAAAAHGDIPERGPRGGKRWLPRYFVRRAAWHVLDHVWEIEDRMEAPESED